MNIFQIFNWFSFLEIISSQSLQNFNQNYQQKEYNLDLNALLIEDCGVFTGIWSKYNPLGITQQIGPVGLMDSNCFHLQSLIGKSSNSLEQINYDCLFPENKSIKKFVQFNTQDGQQHLYQIEINPSEYENVWYLFELLYYPQKGISEFIILKENQILMYKKVDTLLFQENNLKLTIGGSLIVCQKIDIQLYKIQILNQQRQGQNFHIFQGKCIRQVQGLVNYLTLNQNKGLYYMRIILMMLLKLNVYR